MPRPVRRSTATIALAAALAVAGCGGPGIGDEAADKIRPLDRTGLPDTMLGLDVHAEDIETISKIEDPYIEALGVFGLRRPDTDPADDEPGLLQATLQISRFTEESEYRSNRFRSQVINQIGSTTPRAFRIEGQTVYLTSGRRQSIAAWFEGRMLYILQTRADYDSPRGLLREAMKIDL